MDAEWKAELRRLGQREYTKAVVAERDRLRRIVERVANSPKAMDAERKARARHLVAEWRSDKLISCEEVINTLEASLDALDAAEARADRAEAYASDAEAAAARACAELFAKRSEVRDGR